jgi:outer membrane protein TolC
MHRSIYCLTAAIIVLVLAVPLQLSASPLSLREAVSRAVANNPSLAEARIAVTVAEKQLEGAFGRHYPRLSLEASITKRSESTAFVPAQSATIAPRFSDSYAFLGPVLTLPIYQGGQTRTGVQLAELRHSMQQDSAVITRNELIANTVATYHKCLQLQVLVEASGQAVQALAEQQKNARLLFELGRIARVDLLKVEVQGVNEEQRLLALQEGLKNAMSSLRALMGEVLEQDTAPLQLSDRLGQAAQKTDFNAGLSLARSKPKFQIIAKAVDDAALNRRLALGKLLPSLTATAGYQQQIGFNPHYSDGIWYLGASLSLPVFDRSSYADLSRERLQQQRAEQKLRAADNQLRLDLQRASASLVESSKRIAATAKGVEQSRESFRIEQEKYGQGVGTMADLLLAQSAEAQAVANNTQALFDYTIAQLEWHKASGDMEVYLQ